MDSLLAFAVFHIARQQAEVNPSVQIDRQGAPQSYSSAMSLGSPTNVRKDAVIAAFFLGLGAFLGGIGTMSGLVWFEVVTRP